MNNLGNVLEEMRKSKKLTKRDAANGMGIQYTTYCSYEYGRRDPSTEVLKKIAEFYGCTVDDLLGIEKDSPAETAEEPITMDELIQFLQKLGFLKDGEQDISESDLRFLKATIASLGEWFSERTK